MASEAYPPFLEKFKTVMAGPPSFMHIDFEGNLAAAFKAPVTEVATFYYNEQPANWAKGVHDFIDLCVENAPPNLKLHGYATGTTYENDMERDGLKGRAGVLVIGWESVEQHMEFRKMKVFQENAQMMRQQAGAIEAHHT